MSAGRAELSRDGFKRIFLEKSLDVRDHLTEQLNDGRIVTVLGVFSLFVAHLVDDDIVVVAAVVPAVFVHVLPLFLVELLHEASDEPLCHVATLLATSLSLRSKGDIEHLLHVMLLCEDSEERLLLHNILQDKSGVCHSLIIFLATQLVNKRCDDKVLLLSDLALKIIIEV